MINIKQLRKHYGNDYVLRGIDLTIKRGEVVVLLGSSGGGKSTLLRCINMIETPTSGEVWMDGIEMTNPATDLNKVKRQVICTIAAAQIFDADLFVGARGEFVQLG